MAFLCDIISLFFGYNVESSKNMPVTLISSFLKSTLVTLGKCNQGFLCDVGVEAIILASDIEILWGLFSKNVSKQL